MEEQRILSYVKNEPQKIEDLQAFILEKAKPLAGITYVLLYKYHEVQIGLIQGGHIVIERADELTPKNLKELRVFSENGELYIWKQNRELKYRLRIDNGKTGEKVYIYPEQHFMWGDEHDQQDPQTVHEKNRGMRLRFPCDVSKKALPLKYEVRNYYKYDKNTGLIQFEDARLVKFCDKNGTPICE
jgi:CRISPR-associated protein (TIGR03984 family)